MLIGPFAPGTLIQHRHQVNAPIRLVIATTDNPDVVRVFCPVSGRCRVFTWAHKIVVLPTDETVKRAERERALASLAGNVDCWGKPTS